LSFGSETGRTRSGSKGFSSKEKKQKRKKQDFHDHRRARFQEAERHDPEEVRARTVLALDKLGHQVLSTEPGGYDLRAWMRSFNSLLDDFQEKVGTDRITDEFRARREEAVLSLARPSASDEIDREIGKLNQEVAITRAAIEESDRKAAARRASLRDERDACERELKVERDKLAAIRDARESRPFFSRVLKAGPSTEQAEAKVAELESKLGGLEEEIERSRKVRLAAGAAASGKSGSSDIESLEKLESIQKRLNELHSAKEVTLQLAHEREVATKTISDMISSMRLDAAPSSAGGTQAQ